MHNIEKRLILEDTLNQIYSNNYFFEAGLKEFFFQNVSFVSLNDTCMHVPESTCVRIMLFSEEMIIKMRNTTWRVKYFSINNFIIHFGD